MARNRHQKVPEQQIGGYGKRLATILLGIVAYLASGTRTDEFVCHKPYHNYANRQENANLDETFSNAESTIFRQFQKVNEAKTMPMRSMLKNLHESSTNVCEIRTQEPTTQKQSNKRGLWRSGYYRIPKVRDENASQKTCQWTGFMSDANSGELITPHCSALHLKPKKQARKCQLTITNNSREESVKDLIWSDKGSDGYDSGVDEGTTENTEQLWKS